MPYCYTFSYNDSCNCHPEYQEEQCESDTIEGLASLVAQCAAGHPEQTVYASDVFFRQDITESERTIFTGVLEKEMAPAFAELSRKRESEARAKERASLQSKIRAKEDTLAKLLPDLTTEAVERRQAEIDEMRKGLLS